MKTSVNNNQREFGAICRVANQILKERKCTRKEAYAIAKAQLENKGGMTRQKFEVMLKAGRVKFSFRNSRGGVSMTKGTLNPAMITTSYKPAGARVAKDPDGIVFFDTLHGAYRTVLFKNLVEVLG